MPRDGTPPFRAEHIGSLLRPEALRDGFRRLSKGEIDADGFRAIQDECIRDAVAMQEEAGFEAVTDGEFRRTTYISHFVDSVDGARIRAVLLPLLRGRRDGARVRRPARGRQDRGG